MWVLKCVPLFFYWCNVYCVTQLNASHYEGPSACVLCPHKHACKSVLACETEVHKHVYKAVKMIFVCSQSEHLLL